MAHQNNSPPQIVSTLSNPARKTSDENMAIIEDFLTSAETNPLKKVSSITSIGTEDTNVTLVHHQPPNDMNDMISPLEMILEAELTEEEKRALYSEENRLYDNHEQQQQTSSLRINISSTNGQQSTFDMKSFVSTLPAISYNFQSGLLKDNSDNEVELFRNVYPNITLPQLRDMIRTKKKELVQFYFTQTAMYSPSESATLGRRSSFDALSMLTTGSKEYLATTSDNNLNSQNIITTTSTISQTQQTEDISSSNNEAAIGSPVPASTTSQSDKKKVKSSSSLFFKTVDRKVITPEDLVNALAPEDTYDSDFTKVAMLIFRKFYDPSKIVDLLINKFDFYTEQQGSDKIHPVQLRICNVFSHWISKFFDADFNPDLTNGAVVPKIDLPLRHKDNMILLDASSSTQLLSIYVWMDAMLAKGQSFYPLCYKLVESLWNFTVKKIRTQRLLKTDLYPHSVLNLQYGVDEDEQTKNASGQVVSTMKVSPSGKLVMKNNDKKPPPPLPTQSQQPSRGMFQNSSLKDTLSTLEMWFMRRINGATMNENYLQHGVTPVEIAQALTQMTLEAFMMVQSREWLYYLWVKDRRPRIAPNAWFCIQQGKMTVQWIQNIILGFSDVRIRAMCAAKFIETAWICYNEHRNIDSTFLILKALNSPPIKRLHATFTYIQFKLDQNLSSSAVQSTTSRSRDNSASSIPEIPLWKKFEYLQSEINEMDKYRITNMYRTAKFQKSASSANALAIKSENDLPSTIASIGGGGGTNYPNGPIGVPSGPTSTSQNSLLAVIRKSFSSLKKLNRNNSSKELSGLYKSKTETAQSSSSIELCTEISDISAVQRKKSSVGEQPTLFIPHVGLIIDDLAKLEDSQSDYRMKAGDRSDSVLQTNEFRAVNWTKFVNISDVLEEVERYQGNCLKFVQANTDFMDPISVQTTAISGERMSIRNWVLSQNYISRDEMMLKSIEIEMDTSGTWSADRIRALTN